MDQFSIYIGMLGIIVGVGIIARRVPAPTPLLLVIVGMILSFVPFFPAVKLHPDIVLQFFLPLLVYQSTANISWPQVKLEKRPIILLSVGHVIFITVLVAVVAHMVIPQLNWPLAFVLGAVISPPDDVAISSMADRLQMPQRILTVLMGESLLNDATALILFRFSLAAFITHEFYPLQALADFFLIIIGETLYGLVIGHVIGNLRLRVTEPLLQILFSILTPFIAYLPAMWLGGSGVLATVVTALVIGYYYLERFTPETRLLWHSVWDTIGFTLSSILFLLVGLHLRLTLITLSLPMIQLIGYGLAISAVVVIGRFIWVYPAVYLPRFLFPSIRKNDPYPPWQYPFIISWAGMRGGVSLAAALSIPFLHTMIGTTDVRELVIFLVFCVITATLLLQGLTLPWLLRVLGVANIGQKEEANEHLMELNARLKLADTALTWLNTYQQNMQGDVFLVESVRLQIQEYQAVQKRLKDIITNYDPHYEPDELTHQQTATYIFMGIIEAERRVLNKLWHDGKVSFHIRNKLLEKLDLRSKRYSP